MFQIRQISVHRRHALPFQRPVLPAHLRDVDAHPLPGGTPTDAGGGRRMEGRPERVVQSDRQNRIDFEERTAEVFGHWDCQPD